MLIGPFHYQCRLVLIDVEVSDIEVSQPCTDKEEIVLNCTEHLDL